MPLNDLSCKHAKPKSKPYRLYDGEGLCLFIQPNGKKYWRFKYKCNDKENTLSLGNYPETSLQDARNAKDKAKLDLRNGNDPALLRHQKKQLAAYNSSQTFDLIAREWHVRYINNWSPKQAARIMRRLESELFPDLGFYPVGILPRKVVLACLQKAAERSPELGKRLLGYCKQIFEYAGLTDRLDKDLTLGIKAALPKYITEHYACIELDELSNFLKALYAPPPEQHKLANYATKIALLFGCRTTELLKAERLEFRLETKLWTIKSARIKKSAEQRKIKRDHLVPLSKQAIEIILELDKEYGENRKFLLPSPIKRDQAVCKNLILKELKRINYQSIMTAHGFRSLFMSISTEKLKYETRIPDRQLGHVPRGEVLRAYDRAKYLDERIKLIQEYADYLDSQLTPQQPERNQHGNFSNAWTATAYHIGNGAPAVKFQSVNSQQANQIRNVS